MMLRSLLVGVNGTNQSRHALDLGLHRANYHRIPLNSIGVIDLEGLVPCEQDAGGLPLDERDRPVSTMLSDIFAISAGLS